MTLLCLLAEQREIVSGMADPPGWLGVSELERLRSLGTPARRESFLAARWLARRAVQSWQGSDVLPRLEVAASGACEVASESSVYVSISHSAGFVASAVAAVPVGVDIESLVTPRDHLSLGRTVHSPAQCQQLAELAPGQRAQPFLQWWTLKEAWLKARGRGLDFALMRSLEFDNDELGDAAVAHCGDLVLALAADPALPQRIDGPPRATWQRLRSRS